MGRCRLTIYTFLIVNTFGEGKLSISQYLLRARQHIVTFTVSKQYLSLFCVDLLTTEFDTVFGDWCDTSVPTIDKCRDPPSSVDPPSFIPYLGLHSFLKYY